MPIRRLLELAAAHHSLILRRDVAAAGVTSREWRRRVNRGEWVAESVGVYRHALTPDSWRLRARAGLMYLGEEAALYGLTSAAWWGLEVPDPTTVEFLVPRSRRRLDNELVIHTTDRWDTRDLLRHDGARLTSVTRAIIEMAASGRRASDLENAIDSGIRLRQTSVPTLTSRMEESGGSGRDGIRLVRALLLDSGGESFLERRFLRLLRRHGLPRPSLQVVHRDPTSGRARRVDFEFQADRVVVEVSGRLGHTSDRDRQRDARRRNTLQQSGLVMLEFTTADVLDDSPYVLRTLRDALSFPFTSPLHDRGGPVRAT
jgi:very-short-patch-repair endonuclease